MNEFQDDYRMHRREEVVGFLPKNYKRVLEIGCGSAIFRTNLDTNIEYWGVEPDSASIELAKESLVNQQDRFINGFYDEVCEGIPDKHFDLIVCNDVIEHIYDHNGFIESLKTKLAPDGVIAGSIPNVRYLDNLKGLLLNKDWKYEDFGVLDRTHVRFFTEKSLKRTFADLDLEVEDMRGINSIVNSNSNAKRWIKSIVYWPFFLVLGGDTRYLQFGFRLKPKASKD
ncbi:class I SAM-dependent methyltransferase [Vibrio tapetis subsp. quintayensis]|uniref:class I SAM-dependent methyltransferase n=1 Tax=Vibrio tapetis TaxID=52443 RepID=UPI0025B48C3E|nr:class I SAM-dependent methyltransferase [Vibrio tapetis]MDN3679442.1 class I SAM-dependent methyltransferase [Vibrio tapetis subsp. quintayensis]